MSKSDLTNNPAGSTRGHMTGRSFLLAMLAAIVCMTAFVAMSSDAKANIGFANASANYSNTLADPVDFGSGPQGLLPRTVTIWLFNDNSSIGGQTSSNVFTMTGSAYRRNGGTCNGTATGTSWTTTLNSGVFSRVSCSIILELQAGAAVGTQTGTISFTSNRTINFGASRNLTGVVDANNTTADFRDTGNTTTITSYDFGLLGTGTSNSYSTVFRNLGNLPLTTANNIGFTGADAAEFSQTNNCPATLAVGANCTINVTYLRTTSGVKSANLNVSTGNGGVKTITLSGEALPPTYIPDIQDTAGSSPKTTHTFADTPVGEPLYSTYVFTLRNIGNAPLTGANVQAITGPDAADFTRSTTCGATLNSNATCTITVGFAPNSTTGMKSATLEVNSTNGGSDTVALDGNAITGVKQTTIYDTAGVTPLANYTFPNTIALSSSAYTFTIKNTGNINLQNVGTQSLTGADAGHFSRNTTCGAVLAPNAACNVTVTYSPTVVQANQTATLNVTPSNGGSSSISLQGTSLTPSPVIEIRDTGNTVVKSSHSFGNVNLGSNSAYVFTIRNAGDTVLNGVTNQTVTGNNAAEFARTTTCGASLAPGATCTTTITFAPTRAATRTATLTVSPTNPIVTPTAKSVTLSGVGAGVRIMNDIAKNYQSLGTTQKRWLDTPTLAPGGSIPSDIVRVAFEVDAGLADDIEGVEIAGATTTNDTAPVSGFQNIADLLSGVVNVERKPNSNQALVTASIPLSVTSMGIGNDQYGFSNGTNIVIACIGGSYKTDNRRVWFRVRADGGVYSQTVGSVIRFASQNYACPNSQGPELTGQRIAQIDGENVSGNTTTATVEKNTPVTFQFNTRTKSEGVLFGDAGTAGSINLRIRNSKTGDLYRINGGSYTACTEPCTADAEFNNGARVTFPTDVPAQQTVTMPGIPSRGRWIVEGSLRGTDQDLNRFFMLGVLRINDGNPAATNPNLTWGGTLGPRPDTNSNYTITANVTDPFDPVNSLDLNGGKVQVIEWDLDGNHTNGPLNDGFELRLEGDAATGLNAGDLTQPFSTTGKTPGPFQIRARITDNGSVLASDNDAETRTFVYNTTINTPPEPVNDVINIEADDSQPQNIEFRATDVNSDAYRVSITPNGGNDGSLGGNMNGPVGDNTKPYTWPATYTGTDTFAFTPTDDHLGTGPAGVLTVKVRPNTTIDSATFPDPMLHPDAGNPATRFLGSTTSTDADFEFSSPQTPIDGYECKLTNDGNIVNDWASCSTDTTGDISYDNLPDGLYRLEVRAINEDGDADGTPVFRTWRVDNTGPDTEVRIGPPSNLPNQQPRLTNDTTPTYIFRATASERSLQQYLTYECRVMFGPAPGVWYACGAPSDNLGSGPVNIVNGTPDFGIDNPLADGTYEIQVRATDEVGNLGPVMVEQLTVDTVDPETALASGPEGLINTRTVDYVLGSSQGQSTFLCKLEGQNSGVIFPLGPCPGSAADGSRPTFSSLADDIYTLTAIAVDPAQNQDPTPLEVEFEVDATEPATTMNPNVDYGDGPTLLRRTQSRKVDITFSGSDARQLQGFQCRIDSTDDGAWQICSSPQRFSGLADGDHKVEIRAKDQAGNVDSTPEVLEWNVDHDPPVSDITVAPDPVSNDSNPTFEFTTNEAVSGSVCSLDGAAPVACTSPVDLSDLGVSGNMSDGMHQFTVRSTDLAGNVEMAVASVTWRQDTVLPEVTFTSKPAAFTPLGDVDFAWDVKDGNPLVLAPEVEAQCAFDPLDSNNIDGSEWVACDRDLTIDEADNANGAHFFAVRAIDAAGNVSGIASHEWNVLGAKPVNPVIDDSSPADGATTRVGTAYFAFHHELDGTGALDGLFCRIDDGIQARCDSGNFSAEGLSDGDHTFSVVAKDIAGNISDPTSVAWSVQRGAPVTSINFGPSGSSKQKTATFQFSSDKPGTFECRIDGATWEACTSPVELEELADGQHSFSVRAVSTVAPVGVKDPTPPSRTWTVDTVLPDVTITSAPEGQVVSYTGSVGFTSTDPDAGFQCKLDSGLFDDCASPWQLTGLTAGEHTVTVRAVDPVGNVSETPDTATWVVLDPSCGNDFDGIPPDCVQKPEVTGSALKAESTGGTLSLASLGSVDLPENQIKLEGKRGSDGRWYVPQAGVAFQPVTQVLEDVLGPGTSVTVTISISATGNAWGVLNNGGGTARLKIPVRADVDAKLGDLALFPSGTCSLTPVTFNLVGTWDAGAMTAHLEQGDVSFPKLTGCGTFKATIDQLLELPRSDIQLAVDLKLTEEAPVCEPPLTGTPPDCVSPPVPVIELGNPVITGPKKIKFGKKAKYQVSVTNTGDTEATGVKLCLVVPRKFIKGAGIRCATVSVPAGKVSMKEFTVTRKSARVAKTRKVTLRATATYTDGSGTARIKGGKATPKLLKYTAKQGKTGSAK